MFNANTATGRQTANTPPGPFTILRLPAIKARTGFSRSTVYLRISQGLWTKQVSLGPRAVGWPDYECDSLTAARISGKTDAEIRELVVDVNYPDRSATTILAGGSGE